MNSCLYECVVMHHRLAPKRHRFVYRLFMFYLDIDELDAVAKSMGLVSHNRFNVFSYRDADHLSLGEKSTKENISLYLRSKGIDPTGMKIYLLTHLRTFGYIFNPVSFYFCFDADGPPVCVVPEVGNTFGEMKPFFLGKEQLDGNTFRHDQSKLFYVSPFVDLDATFEFRLTVPGERLDIRIDDLQAGKKFLLSSLVGERKRMSNAALIWYSIRFPFITLRVIGLIHWNAFLLWLKRIPYHSKHQHLNLQQEVYDARSN